MMQTRAVAACRRCKSPLAEDDLRCAICSLATPPALEVAPRAIARILRCEGCGAALRYAAEAGAPKCAFCGAVMRLEEPTDPVEQAEHVVPFRVDMGTAQAALHGWMRRLGFFRPSDLATASSVQAMKPLYWAAWIVDAQAQLSWTADSNAGSHRSAWAPHAGQASLAFERLLVSASRGLTHGECAALAAHFDLSSAQPAQAIGAEVVLEQFDAQRSAARRIVVEAIHRTAQARLERGAIPGSRFRHVRVAVLLEGLNTHRVALPTYVLAYRYRGRVFRALVHGQDARCVFGEAPYSIAKIVLVIAAGVLAVALAIGIVAALS